MVAIKRVFLTLLTTSFIITSADAQQIEPRIAGLESNARYMQLLIEDDSISTRESKISFEIDALRDSFVAGGSSDVTSRDKILSCETQLFELRARKAIVSDSLNIIEQAWVLSNMATPQIDYTSEQSPATKIDSVERVTAIYLSQNIKSNLSEIDYQNLVKAERLEQDANLYKSQYIVNCEDLLSLKSSYDIATNQKEGAMIEKSFDSLKMVNSQLREKLDSSWGFVYDNKSFAYSLVMEVLGYTDVLEQEAELMRSAQSEISKREGNGSDELLRYSVQKASMLEYEAIVSNKLKLALANDSLKIARRNVAAMGIVIPQEVDIERRLFIDYAPVEFSTTSIYNATNPIPEVAVYESGVIFRIRLGAFVKKQPVSLFRKTSPIAYQKDERGNYAYYAGGYATMTEAEEAQKLLKKHGFRAPQIVVWSDGKSRNLTTNPLPIQIDYRVEITAETLPAEIGDIVTDAGCGISKVGTDKFIVAPLERETQVDSLVNSLLSKDPNLKIKIDKSEAKLEF